MTWQTGQVSDGMRYAIRVKGHLDRTWEDWFSGWSLTCLDSGETLLTSNRIDQAALHGALSSLRNLHLVILSVTALGDTQ